MPGQWILDDAQSFEFFDDDSRATTPIGATAFEVSPSIDQTARFLPECGMFDGVDGVVTDLWQNETLWRGQVDCADSPTTKSPILDIRAVLSPQRSPHSTITPVKAAKRRKLPILAPKPSRPAFSATASKLEGSTVPGLRSLAPKPQLTDIAVQQTNSSPSPICMPSREDSADTPAHQVKRICVEKAVASSLRGATEFDKSILKGLSSIKLTMGFNTSQPKSRLDMYITALRQMVRSSSAEGLRSSELQRAISAEGVLWTVREAWPAAESYWNMTATFRGFLAAEIWRNFPCERTYRQLPPAYRPTRAQLVIPHSPMIDWLPWPDVRDLAIRYQDQIDIDALFRMAIHNVVAHRRRRSVSRLGDVVSSPASNNGADENASFRVWDLICLEKANGTEPLADSDLKKKAVLRSPSVKAVLRAYELEYDQFDTQKLDDRFFEAFPCLYCDSAASTWKVQSPGNVELVDVGNPSVLSNSAVLRLKSRIELLLESKTSPGSV